MSGPPEARDPLLTACVEHCNGLARVALAGELDLSSQAVLRRALAAAESHARDAIIVDLHGLSFMDSAGLAALLSAMRRAKEAGRRFVVRGAQGGVQRVLAISGLHWLLEEAAGPLRLDDPPTHEAWEIVPVSDGALDG